MCSHVSCFFLACTGTIPCVYVPCGFDYVRLHPFVGALLAALRIMTHIWHLLATLVLEVEGNLLQLCTVSV